MDSNGSQPAILLAMDIKLLWQETQSHITEIFTQEGLRNVFDFGEVDAGSRYQGHGFLR